ncbi:biotin transporter BioY [Aliishimia ponticola]|uniref:Biotin transporter n=1 Tax=Aliishimia ponticola TaxID=2499833 RepID=A0A4S4NGP3_9RHOB|nr:biotin transporter BioY [Aliishimia ponticola]THH38789.1 biotin transporter BioY [Aliishimia ponticola]
MTLAQTAFGTQSLAKKAMMVLGGSLFIAICAQISVPMYPVPMTLQTLAILLVGLSFGARMGAVTVLAYLAEGAMGLPVFANAGNGAAFFGPTGGFLIGFVALAWIAGFFADRGWARSFGLAALAGVIASAVLYIPGVAWPMAVAGAMGLEGGWVGLSAASVWGGFMAPFLIGDLVKAVIAALVISGGYKALTR